MAFLSDITLNPTSYGGTNTSRVYTDVGYLGLQTRLRRVAATANTTPEECIISHTGIEGTLKRDRRMLKIQKTYTDPVKGEVKASAHLVLDAPRGTTVVTAGELKEIIGQLLALYMVAGNNDKFLNGEL